MTRDQLQAHLTILGYEPVANSDADPRSFRGIYDFGRESGWGLYRSIAGHHVIPITLSLRWNGDSLEKLRPQRVRWGMLLFSELQKIGAELGLTLAEEGAVA